MFKNMFKRGGFKMKKVVKNITSFSFIFCACLGFVALVSASEYATLGYNSSHRITKKSLGTRFYTYISSTSVSGSPVVEAQAGRQMFNLVWYDSGKANIRFTGPQQSTTTNWDANGTYNTRATWTNISENTSISAYFDLY